MVVLSLMKDEDDSIFWHIRNGECCGAYCSEIGCCPFDDKEEQTDDDEDDIIAELQSLND